MNLIVTSCEVSIKINSVFPFYLESSHPECACSASNNGMSRFFFLIWKEQALTYLELKINQNKPKYQKARTVFWLIRAIYELPLSQIKTRVLGTWKESQHTGQGKLRFLWGVLYRTPNPYYEYRKLTNFSHETKIVAS